MVMKNGMSIIEFSNQRIRSHKRRTGRIKGSVTKMRNAENPPSPRLNHDMIARKSIAICITSRNTSTRFLKTKITASKFLLR